MPARTSPLRVLRRRAARAVILLLVVGLVSAGGYAAEAVLHDRARPAPALSAADRLRAKAPRSAPKPRATPAPAGSRSAAEIAPVRAEAEADPAGVRRPEPVLLPGPALLCRRRQRARGPRAAGPAAPDRLVRPPTSPAPTAPITTEAVRGFQAKREIPVTGKVDQRTWTGCRDDHRAHRRRAGKNRIAAQPARRARPRCRTGRVLCIDKTSQHPALGRRRRVRRTLDVRFGAVATPTREGTFSVYFKSRDHVSQPLRLVDALRDVLLRRPGGALLLGLRRPRLRRRLARVRERARLRRGRRAVRPGAASATGRRLPLLTGRSRNGRGVCIRATGVLFAP